MSHGGDSRSPFAGKWKLHASENFDEFLKAMDVPWMMRKMAGTMNPKLEVTVEGNHYTFKTITTMKTKVSEFDLDKEYEDEAMDGRKFKCIVKKEGDKLVAHQQHVGFEVVTIREVKGDELVQTIEAKGVKTTRTFRREA